MARQYWVNGETMVYVRATFDFQDTQVFELGLCDGPIRIQPRFFHEDLKADDYGDQTPADIRCLAADCTISMNLVHFDRIVLNRCWMLAMGSPSVFGQIGPVGRIMGEGKGPGARNLFVRLMLVPLNLQTIWRFPAAYITGQPLEYPLGTQRTVANVTWRAIPYMLPSSDYRQSYYKEVVSKNAVLWDHSNVL